MLVQVAALVWIALLATALIAREPPLASVDGVVVAKETARPIPHAQVWASGAKSEWGRAVKADAQGRFRLENVPAGPSYFDGSSKVHRREKDQWVLLKEGADNHVTLTLEPVAPYLRLTMAQHVLTPDEPPALTCSGYTAAEAVDLTVRRFPLSALRNRNESPYTPYDENLTVPASVGESVHAETVPAEPKDAEGALRRKVVLPKLPAGLYSVWVQGKDAKAGLVFSVSTVGLVTKTAGRQVLGYAVDLKSGRPVPDASVTLFHRADVAATGTTDAKGLYQTRLDAEPQTEGALVIQSGESVAFTRAERSYGEQEDLRVYFYTDRPIYRPAQTVYYKAIVRQREGTRYRLPSGRTCALRVRAPSGALLDRRTATVSATGSFHGEFQLPTEAEIGQYSVETSFGRGAEAYSSFNVAEYRKPEYLVTVEPRQKQYVRGDRVEVAIAANYFFGGPVNNAAVSYTVYREPYWGGFSDGDDLLASYYASMPTDSDAGEEVQRGALRTDDAGRALVAFETAAGDSDGEEYLYRIEVEVTDAGRMPVNATGRVVVSRGMFRLEVAPERWVASPGQSIRATIRAVNLDGSPRANSPLEVTIRGRKQTVTTDARGRATVRVDGQAQGGVEIRAEGTDERGNRIAGNSWVWIASGAFSDPSYNYADLEIVADKKRYLPGETAKLMIQTAKPGGAALVTVEGRELYHAEVVTLTAASTLVEIPIDAAYVPNVSVSVTTVRGKTYSRQEEDLQVSPEDHTLKVTVTANKERFAPRETATYTIRTTDLRGRPVEAEASLGLVDESIYSLMPDPPLSSLETFYGFQPNSVNTAFSFPEIYLAGDAKDGGPSAVRRDFPDTASWFPVIRTGADGRATVRVRLPDTLTTWRATVRAHTAATQVGTGIGKVISTKPLLVRLEAPRFFTQNDETLVAGVVHNETDRPQRVTVTLQATGLQLHDSARATLDVPASGMARQDWRATVAPGLEATLLIRAQASPTLGDAVELKKPIVAHGVEHRQGIAGELLGASAAATLTLPQGAIPAATTCRVTLAASPAGVLLSALDYLHAANFDTAENAVGWFLPDMTVAMAFRDLGLRRGGDRTDRTDGTDRTASVPTTNSQRLRPTFEQELARLNRELPRRVKDNLARLYRLQKPEGGWGWGDSGEPDAFWTAYVLYGLDQARRAGYLVDGDVLNRGIQALHTLLPKVKDPSNRALALYVLTQAEQPVTPAVRRALLAMTGRTAKLQNYARSLLALGLADAGNMEAARAVAQTLNETCKETERHATWPEIFPWGFYSCNDNETTGYAMMALIRLDPTNRRIAKAARWLMENRTGDAWASTEDTASVVYALAAYMRHVARTQPADYVATIRVNGTAAGSQRITPATMFGRFVIAVPAKLLHEGDNTVTVDKAGSGPLLYSALLETRLEGENLPARSSGGFAVTREYLRRERRRDIHGRWEEKDIPLRGAVRAGDEILVKLTVNAEKPAREVIVRDALPAGCEGIAEQEESYYGEEGGGGYGGRAEIRDRTVTFTPWLIEKGRNTFEYRMRAQIPGNYHALPTQASCAFIPEIWAAGAENRLTIRD